MCVCVCVRVRTQTHTYTCTRTHLRTHVHMLSAHDESTVCSQNTEHTATHCITLQHIAPRCHTLHHRSRRAKSMTRATSSTTASAQLFATILYATSSTLLVFFLPHCNALLHTAAHWPSYSLQYSLRPLRLCWSSFYHVTTHRNALNALQYTATHYNTL